MPNDYYNVTGAPSQGSSGSSATIRAEFAAMAAGFDKLPTLAGNALELVRVNTGATGLESVPASTLLADYLPVAGGTMTGALLAAVGSAAAPGLAFAGDPNTGWYSIAADSLGLATGGTLRLSVDTSSVVSTLQLQGPAGSAAAPTYAFSGDPNTGMYSGGADTIAWGVNAGLRMTLDGTSLTLRGGGSQALRIHDDSGYLALWNSAGSTRTAYVQGSTADGLVLAVEGALNMDMYTNSVRRVRISSLGEFGFNCTPVSTVLARWQNAGNNDVGFEIQRTSATNLNLLSYDRTGGAYRTMTLSGSTVVIAPDGAVTYSFGATALSPAATNTYDLGGSGAEWRAAYARQIERLSAGDLIIAASDATGRIDLRTAGASALLLYANGKAEFAGGAWTPTDSQSFTATPTFSANASNVHELGTLTANVTSCTITGSSNGQTIQIRVKQDGTGGRTFAAPSGAKIVGSIGATANAASILTLTYSAADARWEGSWLNLPV